MRKKQIGTNSPRFPLGSVPASFKSRSLRQNSFLPALVAGALGLCGCAQSGPQQTASARHSKEYFPSSIYGPASPRVVADGEPVPRGGGIYMVGAPYAIAGHTYYPSDKHYAKTGFASWYGDAFHGRRTANGEVYDRDGVSAAHPTLPLPCYARVTNLRNRYSMIVRVNDRGPFTSNRIIDVSRKVAETLNFHRKGTTKVRVEYIGAASLAGSDDQKLLATLRVHGPAMLEEPEGTGLAPAKVAENSGGGPGDAVPAGLASQPRSEGAAPASAYFKGRPVPLPVPRPLVLHAGPEAKTKLALRRSSY